MEGGPGGKEGGGGGRGSTLVPVDTRCERMRRFSRVAKDEGGRGGDVPLPPTPGTTGRAARAPAGGATTAESLVAHLGVGRLLIWSLPLRPPPRKWRAVGDGVLWRVGEWGWVGVGGA